MVGCREVGASIITQPLVLRIGWNFWSGGNRNRQLNRQKIVVGKQCHGNRQWRCGRWELEPWEQEQWAPGRVKIMELMTASAVTGETMQRQHSEPIMGVTAQIQL
jgi:hypothetical protein